MLKFLQFLTGKKVIFPFYHAISDEKLPHINHLYRIRNVNEFKQDIDYFTRYFQPVGLEELISSVKNKMPVAKPSFFLSFDDGLRQVYDHVFPILAERKVPATIFLNSAFIDNADLFYRYKTSLLIDSFQDAHISLFSDYFHQEMDKTKFKNELLKIDYKNKNRLDEIGKIINIDFYEFLYNYRPYLSKNQIQEMLNHNITIGAHSVDHPDFHFISSKEQIYQVATSINQIVQQFKISYKAFAFPFTDHNLKPELFEILNQMGIDITFGTSGLKDDSVATNMQRIPIEKYTLNGEKVIFREYFYYFIKKFIRKNKVTR